MNLPSLTIAKRVVIKIGSALLVDDSSGEIYHEWLQALADDVAACRQRNQDIILVSSGAIATGRRHLGLTQPKLKLEEKQAAAATGQIRLAHAYQEALARHNITVAQILVTPEDTEDRQRHLNARATIEQLLKLGAVPIINENDTIATAEIRFGDNDRLAARVAQMVSADTLVLLSDIDGLYTADPRTDPAAVLIPLITDLTPSIEAMAGKPPTGYSSGGMVTKLAAARIALGAGCKMVIAKGKPLHALRQLEAPDSLCTWFLPNTELVTARKGWIVAHLRPRGHVVIDQGAETAILSGKSLLFAGITGISGSFERGDLILIQNSEGKTVGRGLSAYPSTDALLIKGKKSGDIEAILGYQGRDELIHRDNLVID